MIGVDDFFFFSSRRRHTRCSRDWSSDVCSSDLNGIRARAAQLCEWLERDRPDIVCLQELKATTAQIPAECRVADYHAYWHTLKGYSGVSLHIRKDLYAVDPIFSHPPFDMESRIV